MDVAAWLQGWRVPSHCFTHPHACQKDQIDAVPCISPLGRWWATDVGALFLCTVHNTGRPSQGRRPAGYSENAACGLAISRQLWQLCRWDVRHQTAALEASCIQHILCVEFQRSVPYSQIYCELHHTACFWKTEQADCLTQHHCPCCHQLRRVCFTSTLRAGGQGMGKCLNSCTQLLPSCVRWCW